MAEENWIYSPSGIGYNWQFQPAAYQERFARNANQISSVLVTKWDDAGQLKADLMESAEYVAGQAWLKRITPLVCPESDYLYLADLTKQQIWLPPADATGYGTQTRDDETGWWSGHKLSYLATFVNLPYQVKEDDAVKSLGNPELNRYCTVYPQPLTQNRIVSSMPFVIDGGAFNGKAVSETLSEPETLIQFNVKQWQWPKAAIPWTAIFARSGRVNDATFTVGDIAHPAETLLYQGLASQPEEYTGPDGEKYVDLVHSVIRHPENWNKTRFNGAYEYIKLQDSSPAIRRFSTVSFTAAFNPV